MTENKHYFFCGIGGSGMLPLAMLLRARGHHVDGSDRALDQGRTEAKFDFLRAQGIGLYPQDGSGITRADQILVASAAVEDSVPDVQSARRLGAPRTTRAELLAEMFNAAARSIGVAGTSGKSTTTGMIGWMLHAAGARPTIMNGAVMQNFVTPEAPFASAVGGDGDLFVSEVDESDGSITYYRPKIGVLTNIALDHKPMEELRALFGDFAKVSERLVVNLDNDETAAIAAVLPGEKTVTFSLHNAQADVFASNITPAPDHVRFDVSERASGDTVSVRLAMPGRHNVANALAALAAVCANGLTLDQAGAALATFSGIQRRLEIVGQANGVTVIDDFAHNPDKIAATLATLHETPGRLLILFQPHGFGPLRLMKDGLVESFAAGLGAQDVLVLTEPVYYGGTVERTVTSGDVVREIAKRGAHAKAYETRAACGEALLAQARPGDRIVVMGARDDTLSQFAGELLQRLSAEDAVSRP